MCDVRLGKACACCTEMHDHTRESAPTAQAASHAAFQVPMDRPAALPLFLAVCGAISFTQDSLHARCCTPGRCFLSNNASCLGCTHTHRRKEEACPLPGCDSTLGIRVCRCLLCYLLHEVTQSVINFFVEILISLPLSLQQTVANIGSLCNGRLARK